ncbi:hypothetical protein HK104_004590, partial [Borealophlyctis nickersoniae]
AEEKAASASSSAAVPTGGLVGSGNGPAGGGQSAQQGVAPAALQIVIPEPLDEDQGPVIEDLAIVDLMFEPGKLLPLGSPEAEAYQRMS